MYEASLVPKTNSPDKKAVVEKLISWVKEKIASGPFEFDGSTWAIVNREDICGQLGISLAAFRKIIASEPFVYDVIKHENVKRTLLRLGPKGPMTARVAAKVMAKFWPSELKSFNQDKYKRELEAAAEYELKMAESEKVGDHGAALSFKLLAAKHSQKAAKAEADAKISRRETPAEFGCFQGLAECWGPEISPKLFRYVIRNWPRFMVQLKLENQNEEVDEKLGGRYYEFPAATVIRKFWWIAFELVLHDFQEGKNHGDKSIQQAMLKVVDGKSLAESPHKKSVVGLIC